MTGRRFNPDKVDKLHDPEREKILPSVQTIRDFGIVAGDIVADLGAGSGYFTIPIAKETGETVYAVDVQPKMFEHLKARAAQENVDSIQYVESDLEDIALPDAAAEKAIASFVLHEVGNLDRTLSEIKRILKPGGKVLVIEWVKKETESGPPLHERLHPEEIVEPAAQHGFAAEVFHPNDVHFGVILSLT